MDDGELSDLIAKGDRVPATVAEARAEYLRLIAAQRDLVERLVGLVEILRRRTRLVLLVVAAGLLLLGGASVWLQLRQSDQSARQAEQTATERTDQLANTHALCTLRGDLQTRIDQSLQFLASHPGGFAGVPAATIAQSVTGQEHTVAALSGLVCTPPAPKKHPKRR